MKHKGAIILFATYAIAQICFSAETIGTFSDVKFIEQEGDCVGYEIKLWKENGKVAGQLRDYEGSCEAETLVLQQIHYNSKTGSISFKVPRGDGFVHIFNGVLNEQELKGNEVIAKEPIPKNAQRTPIVLKKKATDSHRPNQGNELRNMGK